MDSLQKLELLVKGLGALEKLVQSVKTDVENQDVNVETYEALDLLLDVLKVMKEAHEADLEMKKP